MKKIKEPTSLTRKEINMQSEKRSTSKNIKIGQKRIRKLINSKVTKVFYGTLVHGIISVFLEKKIAQS